MKCLLSLTLLIGCTVSAANKEHNGWFILRWVERPSKNGPSTKAKPEDRVKFKLHCTFDMKHGADAFSKAKAKLQEGDVIAYRMEKWEARKKILKGDLTKVGYRLLKYGHLAILVKDPDDPTRLRLFSSQSFKGPNVREDIDTLRDHDWDGYRLDKWKRIDKQRLSDFVKLASKKAGKWYGYDFSGMFGLWNSKLEPKNAKEIGHDYICSTIVVAALYYAGVELDAVQRAGIGDLVSPKQVVVSKGRIIPLPEATIRVEKEK